MAYYVLDSDKQLAVFNHVPKTGGTWVRQAFKRFGLRTEMVGMAHQTVIPKGEFSFRFVRNPLTWYSSMFAYRQATGWPDQDSFLWSPRFRANNLTEFVINVARMFPRGYLTQLYAESSRCTFTGKFENLAADTAEVLKRLGKENLNELYSFAGTFVNSVPHQEELTASMAKMVLRWERKVFERYGYPLCLSTCR